MNCFFPVTFLQPSFKSFTLILNVGWVQRNKASNCGSFRGSKVTPIGYGVSLGNLQLASMAYRLYLPHAVAIRPSEFGNGVLPPALSSARFMVSKVLFYRYSQERLNWLEIGMIKKKNRLSFLFYSFGKLGLAVTIIGVVQLVDWFDFLSSSFFFPIHFNRNLID